MTPITLDDLEQQLRAAIDADDHDRIVAIGRELDSLDAAEKARRPKADNLAAALWYAEQGLHVFALTPGSKIPHKDTAGCKDATTDAETIRAWWDRWPGSNVAIATGHLVDVIDIDGLAGQASYAEHLDDFAGVQILGLVTTPRPGGMHLYIPATGHGNRAGILPSVDHRGMGGYVVAPPSTNDVGSYAFLGGGLQLDAAIGAAA